MAGLPDSSVDAVVTDPPYGLSFMGKKWDYEVPSVAIWRECLRVLKPGGHLLSFAGTRTQHRMAVNIEDGGFEVRDMIAWVYGQGFPKSLDVSKAIDKAAGATREVVGPARLPNGREHHFNIGFGEGEGFASAPAGRWNTAPATAAAADWQGWGTALKPAMEPITVARKPLAGTVVANVLAHGTGVINIDGCRVPTVESTVRENRAEMGRHGGNLAGAYTTGSQKGRFPANLIHDGSDEVVALFPQSNGQQGAVRGTEPSRTGDENTNCYGEYGPRTPFAPRNDGGSAARFFYWAKASKSDRNSGGVDNRHPTVKPTDLMRYLCRLVTPPGGVVLDPFSGSGSTGVGAVLEGFRYVGIEQDPEYVALSTRRLAAACSEVCDGVL